MSPSASSRSNSITASPPRPALRIPGGNTAEAMAPPPVPRRSSSAPARHSPTIARSTFHLPTAASPMLPRPPPSPLCSTPPPSARTPACVPESPIAHARRAPSPARAPPMHLQSTKAEHTLSVDLPDGLAPEMVTVSAKKGARLSVVADLWHQENDSHYEWEVAFAPLDVDMRSVRAVFDADGELAIHVRRRRFAVEDLPTPEIRTQL